MGYHQEIQADFSGLSPGAVGLYQVNFRVHLIQSGIVTNTALLPVAPPVP
jgi:uncharacterized protein (TIGR03437 family)